MALNSLKYFLFFIFFIFGMYLTLKGFLEINNINYEVKITKQNDSKKINTLKKNEVELKHDIHKKIDIHNNNEKDLKDKINYNTSRYKEKLIIVKKNDTFSKIINPFFNNQVKNLIIDKINKIFNLKNLNIGQKIYLFSNDKNQIKKIIIPISFDKDLTLNINGNDITINEEKINFVKESRSLEFTISSSLYEDGIKAGVPISILIDSIRLYSFDIDFQRDIKKDTKFEITFETLSNSKRKILEYGKIEYINLSFANKDLEYFIFKTDKGFYDYFNREGKNIKKSILKTPIDGARLSSNFGMRKHPISGYNKLHKGVDFAAPKGTPVYAGGDGSIDYLGRNGGYGKYIRIRHNNEYKTAYAHLSNFKNGLKKNDRVSQGDIIGYVGSTGNSTGPHLHYEILLANKQINPMKLELPSGKILKGSELKRFNKEMNNIYSKHLFTLYE